MSHSMHQYTHTQRDRSHSTYYGPRHGRHFSRSQSSCHSHCDRSSSSEDTSCAPHPAMIAACIALWLMDAPITTCAMMPTGIVTSHPTLTTSLADITHTTPQTRAGLTPATPTTLHRKNNKEKPSYVQDLQPPP